MSSKRDPDWKACVTLAAVLGGCALAAGCRHPARLWADTAMPTGGFSVQSRQWAYDGEPVTFELDADGPADYVVFGTNGDETVVDTTKVFGKYRWTRAFHAGPEAQDYEVYAAPYLIRIRRDWIYDKKEDAWYFYPSGADKPDIRTAEEKVIRITCYRKDIRLRLRGRGGAPEDIKMTLIKAAGRRASIQRCPDPTEGKPGGFLVLGPDERGMYEVAYSPTYQEVSRSGKTRVELLVRHADGSLERIQEDLHTP